MIDSFLLNIPLLRFFLSFSPVVAQGRSYMLFWGLAVVIGIYSFRYRFLPCNGAFIVLSTVSTGGVVTVEDIIESIEWLSHDRP